MTLKGACVPTYTVRDVLGEVTFRGELLSEQAHNNADPSVREMPRWTDMRLIKVKEHRPPHRYVVEIIARSVVYHDVNGECQGRKKQHRHVTVGELFAEDPERYDQLVPCPRCNPRDLDELAKEDVVRAETDQHELLKARYAADIIRLLYENNGKISSIAAAMIKEAAGKDEHIQRVLDSPRRLGW